MRRSATEPKRAAPTDDEPERNGAAGEDAVEVRGAPIEVRVVEDAWKVVRLRIVGMSPYMPHRKSERMQQQMEAKQTGQGGPGAKSEKRNYQRDMDDARYLSRDGKHDCIPCAAIKEAMIRAAKSLPGMTMTDARGMFFVRGVAMANGREGVVLDADKPVMDKEPLPVGIKKGSTDIRVRPRFDEWAADVEIEYLECAQMSPDILVWLLKRAGRSVGIGDYRPECSGTNGRFEVEAA